MALQSPLWWTKVETVAVSVIKLVKVKPSAMIIHCADD